KASGLSSIYIATGQALDDEMADRITAHKIQRGDGWQTIEEPLDLCGALVRTDGQGIRLVDCLTLWLSNLFLAELDWDAKLSEVLEVLQTQQSPVVLVTNEVGWGIVPMSDMGRRYRDASGVMNQRIAEVADAVLLVTCGLPLSLKG
ncbi:bifunctional adenosylcobinamide kinase/adenosylcobinamide-phosphate guanylyltransferase, partial [Sulfitobacter sp.]|uniref:bifunctional adenosylcobinamide kinase/adenosylcobinamide-phosphate guanylyltransferase n=1 Tax=Sulfitobacter sp. TaxID=1903071 RepID=UPI003567066E